MTTVDPLPRPHRRFAPGNSADAARRCVGRLPPTPGVYRFRDVRGRALYLGRATDLRHRVGSYWSDLGDRGHLARMVVQIERIEAVACDSAHEAAWLERNLLEASMPRWNRAGGQEMPVWIDLDDRPHRPRLRVLHDHQVEGPRRPFGPYLGGERVRQAIAAFHRILPLTYTGTGRTGSERDMGRHRGVTDADREWIIAATAAVLARHPDAVARAGAALDDLRDRAAAGLRFELAARIQAEHDALEWITSPQRVTVPSDESFDIHGWSDGLLVHYAVRSGRLSRWAQQPASWPDAMSRVATTPPAWTDFAQRNAELAAALRAG